MIKFLYIILMSLQVLAGEKKDCANLMANFDLHQAKIEIAELLLEKSKLDSNSNSALRSLIEKNIKQKIGEFKTSFGIELDATEIKSLVAQIEEGSLKKINEELKKEIKTRETEDETIMKWRRQIIHSDVKLPGPFINDSQFFTVKDKKLSIYDFREKKYIWEESLKNGGQGQDLSWESKLLLTPQKDILVIVDSNSIGLLDINSGDYKSGSIKKSRGFRVAKISQDGRHVFLGGEDGESIIYELPSLKVIFGVTKGQYPHGKGIVESPDGRYVFFIRFNGDQVLYDLIERREIRLPELKSSKFHHCHDAFFSQDSKTLTMANHNSQFLDFDITKGILRPSKYKSNGKNLFTSPDGELVIIGRDTAYPEGKDDRPFTILKESSGDDVTPDMSAFDIERVTQLWEFPEQSKIVFQDLVTQTNPKHPYRNYIYMVDLKSLEVARYENAQNLVVMGILEFSPDGNSLFIPGKDGNLVELH